MSSPGCVGCSLLPSRKPAAAQSRSRPSSFKPSSTTSRTTWRHRPIPSSSPDPQNYLRRQELSQAWTAACAVVGIEGVRPHDLRHHAATVIARNPNVTLRELMATIGHSSHVATLRYQHATAERSKEIADHLDGVITAATAPNRPSPPASVHDGCGMGVARSKEPPNDGSEKRAPKQAQHFEAAGGIEPPYGALQAPASRALDWDYLVARRADHAKITRSSLGSWIAKGAAWKEIRTSLLKGSGKPLH
jgi:hypothetical protein